MCALRYEGPFDPRNEPNKSNQDALDVCVLRDPKNPHSPLNDPYESKQDAQIDLRAQVVTSPG